jgi:methylated-DNA-[protein]-cysteine S-methyltransferase
MNIIHITFKTPFGWCGIVKDKTKLLRVFLPEPEMSSINNKIKFLYPLSIASEHCFSEEKKEFERYFAGLNANFSFALDFSHSTSFQKMVWLKARAIPYGEVRSYTWIAKRIGTPKAVRAVGNALGKNPFPIIVPCHRVIRKTGRPGGFSTALGTELKVKLLRLEAGEL